MLLLLGIDIDYSYYFVRQIARQADNLHWMLDILMERQIADDFLRTWTTQSELAEIHGKVPSL